MKRPRTLNDILTDHRTTGEWHREETGYWVTIADGYNQDGCSELHEETIAELCIALQCVEKGEPF